MLFHRFACQPLAQSCYLIADGHEALVVDPMRDVDAVLAFIRQHGLRVRWVVGTHVHADFVAGLGELAAATGAEIGLGVPFTGRMPCTRLAHDSDVGIGDLRVRVLATPGHTQESISLLVPGATGTAPRLLSGDTLFVGEVGRPDLAAGGDGDARTMATQLFASLHDRILTLPDETEIWPAHGAGSMCGSRIAAAAHSTLADERRDNWALQPQDEQQFCRRLLGSLRPPPRYFARVAAINLDGPALLSTVPAPQQLEVTAAEEALTAGACVLDVRTTTEHGRGHWPQSFHIGLDEGEFESWAGVLLPPCAIVLHCVDRQQALAAHRRLLRIGNERVLGFVCALPASPGRLPQIDAIDLFAPDGDSAWQIVDVRRPDEFADGHVPAAVSCELAPDMAPPAELDPERATALVCEGGYRSSAAARLLRARGFTDLHNVRDGMPGWRSNHLPQARAAAAERRDT